MEGSFKVQEVDNGPLDPEENSEYTLSNVFILHMGKLRPKVKSRRRDWPKVILSVAGPGLLDEVFILLHPQILGAVFGSPREQPDLGGDGLCAKIGELFLFLLCFVF